VRGVAAAFLLNVENFLAPLASAFVRDYLLRRSPYCTLL
jgi:hypothetical protein